MIQILRRAVGVNQLDRYTRLAVAIKRASLRSVNRQFETVVSARSDLAKYVLDRDNDAVLGQTGDNVLDRQPPHRVDGNVVGVTQDEGDGAAETVGVVAGHSSIVR